MYSRPSSSPYRITLHLPTRQDVLFCCALGALYPVMGLAISGNTHWLWGEIWAASTLAALCVRIQRRG